MLGLPKRVDIGSLHLNESQVLSALNGIDTTKGDGPDNISPLFLKKCADTLCAPLLRIFNLSLSKGFPNRWKESYVVPIFKSGSRSDIECYRDIAILPTFGKLFESIVCEFLTDKLKGVISLSQHGFVRGRSTSTNLLEFVSETIRIMEKGHQVDVVYTDIRKAFDRVLHSSMICKLRELGIHSSMLDWIRTYLSERKQYVNLMGWKSHTYSVTSGLPQGSHLGPLLFLIFFDDVTRVIKSSKCLLYADDLKIFRRITSLNDCVALQNDISALNRWCQDNSLLLNVGKCTTMSFFRTRNPFRSEYHIEGATITRVTEMRDLGVTFTENLSFNKHMDIVVAKAYAMLGFIKRICRDFRNIETLKSIFFAHVRSHLEYASVVWPPYYQNYNDKIESIQKKFLIYALRRTVRRDVNYRLPSYISKCQSIGIESLSHRRLNLSAMFVFDMLNNRIDAPNLCSKLSINRPNRSIRNASYLVLDNHRFNYGLFEPVNNLSRIFNMFAHLYSGSISRFVFRRCIKLFVLTEAMLKRNGFLLSID